MGDPMTNGWLQLALAAAAALSLVCFFIVLDRGDLRFPGFDSC